MSVEVKTTIHFGEPVRTNIEPPRVWATTGDPEPRPAHYAPPPKRKRK